MSYGVDILQGHLPTSYEEALEERDEATGSRDEGLTAERGYRLEEPSDQMRELHRRLTARYPCISEDPEGPWSDGPLINNFGQSSATLGISFSRVREVLPFLITTATAMGFWVFDAQDEVVHLPGGVRLSPDSPLEQPQRAPG